MKKIIFTFSVVLASCALFAGSGKNTPPKKDTISLKKLTKPMDTSKYVIITTEYGDIKIRLYDETPQHRDNFIKLAKQGFFDSTLFHRVIPTFMIQGGDPNSKTATPGQPLGMGDVGYRIPAEFSKTLIHKRGVLAAARDGNPEKASSGCQFYITVGKKYTDDELARISMSTGVTWTEDQKKIYREIGGTPMLDMNYTVFGEVVSGIDIVDKIVTEPRDPSDRPYKDIRMKVKVAE